MNTYKMHALGDYAETIRKLGTSESYSTQVVRCFFHLRKYLISWPQGELEHRRVKRLYGRTNKNNYEEQIAKQEQRQRILREVRRRLNIMDTDPTSAASVGKPKKSQMKSLEAHHYISHSGRTSITIGKYLTKNKADPAFKVKPILICIIALTPCTRTSYRNLSLISLVVFSTFHMKATSTHFQQSNFSMSLSRTIAFTCSRYFKLTTLATMDGTAMTP